MLDWGNGDQMTHRVGKVEQALTPSRALRVDCSAGHRLDPRSRKGPAEEVVSALGL
jgi:hypothetical protein